MRLDLLVVSVEKYGARINVLSDTMDALEMKGGVSVDMIVEKADIVELKKEVAALKLIDITLLRSSMDIPPKASIHMILSMGT